MTVFWLAASLLVVGAWVMLLPALLRPPPPRVSVAAANLAVHRDQWREAGEDLQAGLISPQDHALLREELARQVIGEPPSAVPESRASGHDRITAALLALLIPLASVLLYLKLGAPPTLPAAAVDTATAGHALSPAQIRQMVQGLGERLKANPSDAAGWRMLGRSYTVLGRFADAVIAQRRAAELLPRDADVLTDLADVLAMSQGRRLAGEPARLVQQALDIDPAHPKALALAGSVAFEARDHAAARHYWQRLLAVVPAGSPIAVSFQASLREVDALEAGQRTAATAPSAASTQLSGEVSISPTLAARLEPGSTLIVFARPATGSRMPLAVLRVPMPALPFRFRLDDSLAVTPQARLSAAGEVIVGARVSRDGQAQARSGELVGQLGPLRPGAGDLRLVIDQVQP